MATKGYLDQLLNALPPDIKNPVSAAFQYMADNWRFGDGDRAQNAQLYKFTGVTAATANEEFSIRHGAGQTPSKLIPALDLTQIGSQIVPLTVSRAPDDQRIYLTSSSTGATFITYVEF